MGKLKEMVAASPALHRHARQAKRLLRLVIGRDRLYHYDVRPHKELLGTVYGGWMIVPSVLHAGSVVYSFGVGNDISFDLALIERFGSTVHGFDPSPGAIQFIADRSDLPPRYVFHPYGFADRDGEVRFRKPATGSMYSLVRGNDNPGEQVIFPVRSLATIMESLQTPRIDVLKMDIEGAEYALIDTLIEHHRSIGQLLIEFHHRVHAAPISETVNAVNRLRAAGFQLFHVSETSSEFSFLRNPD